MTTQATKKSSVFETKTMAKIAILSAIAFVLMLFEFPVPVAPSFYKLDFSEVAVMIGGFALGPIPAVAIEGMKVILNLLFNGTITMGVGEFANFAIGCAMAVPAAAIYHRNKTRKSALIGMLVGTLVMTVTGVVLNYLVLIPAYVSLAHFPMDAIIGMGQAIFPFIKNTFDLVIACVTPFNLIKGVLVSLITILLYKHVSPLLHK